MPARTLNDFIVTDDTIDNLAAYNNRYLGSMFSADNTNTISITAVKELADSDCIYQVITTDGSAIELPPEADTNHPHLIYNTSAANTLPVKDDSGVTTFITLAADEWALFMPIEDEGWEVVEGRGTLKTYFDTLYAPVGGGSSDPAVGTMSNGKLSVAVAANDLYVYVKTLAGADPSVGDPVKANINGTVYEITATLGVMLADATNWMGLGGAMFATLEQDLFAYLGYNATDGVVIGVSRIPFAHKYGDFSTTNTDEDYCKISTITTAASSDPYMVIGRFAATLSAGAGYTWTVPSPFTPDNLIQRPIFNTRILPFVPQFTNLTVGSAAVQARYMVDGRKCLWNFGMVWAADTSISGSVTFTLPFTRSDFYSGSARLSNALVKFTDATGGGTGNYAGICQVAENANEAVLLCQTASATYLYIVVISSTVPFTWTTSDEISVDNGQYFIA